MEKNGLRLKFTCVGAAMFAALLLAGCGESGNDAAVLDSPTETAMAEGIGATITTAMESEVTDIPTPVGNLWRGLSFEQAQEVVPFPLIRPDPALSWVDVSYTLTSAGEVDEIQLEEMIESMI